MSCKPLPHLYPCSKFVWMAELPNGTNCHCPISEDLHWYGLTLQPPICPALRISKKFSKARSSTWRVQPDYSLDCGWRAWNEPRRLYKLTVLQQTTHIRVPNHSLQRCRPERKHRLASTLWSSARPVCAKLLVEEKAGDIRNELIH